MKRIIATLILLFMVASIFIPFLPGVKKENMVLVGEYLEPTSTVTQEIVQEEEIVDPYTIYIEEMQSKMSEIESIKDTMKWYIAYKDIISEYSDILDAPETIYDCFTEGEIYLMQRVVETECHDGDFKSKVNVANVILNRIYDSETFGKSVEEVITSPNQFAYGRKIVTESTILALEYAFQIEDTTNGCVAFHSNSAKPTFNKWVYVFTDDIGHHFYREEK